MNIQSILALTVLFGHNQFGYMPNLYSNCGDRQDVVREHDHTLTFTQTGSDCNFTTAALAVNASCLPSVEKQRFIALINGLNEYLPGCAYDFVYILEGKKLSTADSDAYVRLHKIPISSTQNAVYIFYDPEHFIEQEPLFIKIARFVTLLLLIAIISPILSLCCL